MVEFYDRRSVDVDESRGTISHSRAKEVAAQYTDLPGLGNLAQRGSIQPAVFAEISSRINSAHTQKEKTDLSRLRRYAEKSGLRGPVRSWNPES